MKTVKKHFPLCLTVGSIVILWTLIVGLRTANARTLIKTRLATQHDHLLELQSKCEALRTRQNEIRDLNQRCVAYQQQLPPIDTFESTLASIKQLAEVNSLAIEPARAMPTPPMPGLTRRIARLNIHGSFNAFYAFLTQLETTSPSLIGQAFEIKRPGNADADLSASVTIEMLFRSVGPSDSNQLLGAAQ